MQKRISILLVFAFLFSMCGCSRETKMGIGEYFDRIHTDYGITIDEKSLLLEKGSDSNTAYCNLNSFLLVFYLGSTNNITGIAGMISKDKENNLSSFFDDFQKCVSVFTMSDKSSVEKTFKECKFTADSIKFTDGNSIFTVGKFKYSIITSEQSITVFCERT